ncbi:YicC family protein [soil metagenome]
MIRSMTGFGEGERDTPAGRLRIEVRTVNHRHLNLNVRGPAPFAKWEPQIREWVRERLARGHVNCAVSVSREGVAPAVRLNTEYLEAHLGALREAAERYAIPGEIDLAMLAGLRELTIRDEGGSDEAELAAEEVRGALGSALEGVIEMRESEGARLQEDLQARLDGIEAALDGVEARAPERLVAERDRLRGAVEELAGGVAVDPDRLAQEIALLAERWDVNEELVRFRSHATLFRELIAAPSAEAVGKRLAFLVQEMHREANTIGAKANDAQISHRVVALKDEVEKLREQVENVE